MNGNRQQSRLPKQCKGTLTPEKAAIGITAVMTNAALLLTDAELLLQSKRCNGLQLLQFLRLKRLESQV